MLIVRVTGGLGNQMFQYALYKSLINIGKDEVKLDIFDSKNYLLHNGYELEKVFNVKPNKANINEISKLKVKKGLIFKLLYKIKKNTNHIIRNELVFDDNILNSKGKYLQGYWQSEKYFINVRNELLKDFKFKEFSDDNNIKLMNIIKKNNSISIHVRRGDYLNEKNKEIYGGICNEEYYLTAINFIKKKIDNPLFIIFSNDIKWCKKFFSKEFENDRFIYVNWNKGENSYKDMQLMSICDNNIIANSSFSWWGAWLNKNKKKIIISPKKWMNNDVNSISDIIPNEWIKI